ncbi:MAG: DsbA family protein [Candidatus Aenigmarchaeota archaeon]|nr:DsbA family protein [Candidatus Aenigmarchaeota archaeon]
MAFRCGCGKDFSHEQSLLQHQRDAHGQDTSARLMEIIKSEKSKPESARESHKIPRYYIYGLGVLALVMAGFFFLQPAATGAAVSDISDNKAASAKFLEVGDIDAQNVIEEFGDYECPFCTRFHTTTFTQLKKDFIDTGKARYIFKDFPLAHAHFNAQKAAEAAHCAGEQGKYEEYHDKLYQNSYSGDKWGNRPAINAFKKYATDLGLDAGQFNKCLDSGSKSADVRANLAEGQQRGVSGTPSFFVNGRFVSGAQPYSVFAQMMK